jgi:hypothetical protein
MVKQEMTWNSRDACYHGVTSDGREIVVQGDEYAESEQDGCPSEVLNDPDQWATCIGANQNVAYIVK